MAHFVFLLPLSFQLSVNRLYYSLSLSFCLFPLFFSSSPSSFLSLSRITLLILHLYSCPTMPWRSKPEDPSKEHSRPSTSPQASSPINNSQYRNHIKQDSASSSAFSPLHGRRRDHEGSSGTESPVSKSQGAFNVSDIRPEEMIVRLETNQNANVFN
jgi:hypothetical protein